MNKIRALRADEVECRVANITAKGCSLLLYKDARCDKRILDETFGINGWRNHYEEIKGNLFCTIEIWDDEKKQWISKQDCGTESYAEKEKGEASDAFKRAAFNIGIGRELYTKIFIWINTETEKDQYGKYKLSNNKKWHVLEMEVDNDKEKITFLQIVDSKSNNVEFTFGYPSKPLTCIKCGGVIEGGVNDKGKYISPEQVAKVTGAKCKKCYEEAKKGVRIE